MEKVVPDCPEDLARREASGNPVVIAGYGRESTHKGYLSWMLSETHSGPTAARAVEALLAVRHPRAPPEQAQRVTEPSCLWEQPFGHRRKVDLLVDCQLEGQKSRIPIELKTDSGPTGKQFDVMSEHAGSDTPCIVLLLGTSALWDPAGWKSFLPVCPADLICVWGELAESGRAYFRDWLSAVACELARQKLALELYRENMDKDDWWWRYGYRSHKTMMYCVLDHVREALRAAELGKEWRIYDGGHNSVMSIDWDGQNWQLTGVRDMKWFFEFNDSMLVLKVDRKDASPEYARRWVKECRREIEAIEKSDTSTLLDRAEFGSIRSSRNWITVAKWNCHMADDGVLVKQVRSVFEAFGANGAAGFVSSRFG